MLTQPQSQWRNTLTGAAGVSVAAAQTLEDKVTLTKQNRRLAGIDFQLRVTTSGVAYTTTHSGIAGLVKRIKLLANDGVSGAQRPIVDVSGPELLLFTENCEINTDRYTAQGLVSDVTGLTTSYAYVLNFFMPCYDPELGEKAIPFMSLPLYLMQDPTAVIQVDLGTAADIGATGGITGNVFLDWKPRFRIETTPVKYIPFQLYTDTKTWGATGAGQYDFTQLGLLTKFQVSQYTSATARGDILTSPGGAIGKNYQLKQGFTDVDQFTENWQIALSDRSRRSFPQGTTAAAAPTPALAYRNFPNSFLYSFVKDPTTGEAFGVQSAIDLRVKGNNTERFSLFMNDIAAVNYQSLITMFRLMPTTDADLNVLYGGV